MRILGVDCATKPKNTGLCCVLDHRIEHAETGDGSVAERLAAWIEPGTPTLLAFDAPLGWPSALAPALVDHRAGDPLRPEANELFHRLTDDEIQERLGKRPLEVGADLIARTAREALSVLQELRDRTGLSIPLGWEGAPADVAVIEVYPAATLQAHGFRSSGYKGGRGRPVRESILDDFDVGPHREALAANADVFDAWLCTLAGRDYLEGRCVPPTDAQRERALIEGWIWVRSTD